MTNPLTQTPSMLSNREYRWTMAAIAAILLFVAIVTSITFLSQEPAPTKEVYVFPNNTYTCTYENNDGEVQKICRLEGPTPTTVIVPPTASIQETNTTESNLKAEVSQ